MYLHILWYLESLFKLTSRALSVYMSDAPDLAELLPLLPNLDTLEVLAGDYPEASIERSFRSVKLPRIRTLVISPRTHHLMKCCTNTERVIICPPRASVVYRESVPFVADSLVYLALCLPTPECIRGAGIFYRHG